MAMGISSKNRKRILTFLLIPFLIVILIIAEDVILRGITSAILVIYVAFIIFLRDSVRSEDFKEPTIETEAPYEPPLYAEQPRDFDTDDGEGFEIISQNKNLEVITADDYKPPIHSGTKDIYKPPDFKKTYDTIVHEELPKDLNHDEQFSFVLEKVLNVAKDAFMAHTSLFFWYNKNKNRLTLEKFISSSSAISEQKFDLEDDILGKIILKEEPELLSTINPTAEADIIRYYSSLQGIKSFVGVPLFYKKSIAGILALDSKVNDAFGIETVYSLGRFVRVISILITLFEERFAESQADQRLKVLLGILGADKKFMTESDLFSSLEQAVNSLIHWDAFTFVYFYPSEQKFKATKIINKTSLKYVGESLEVDLSGTLVGKAILSGIPVKIDDTSSQDYKRFNKNEDVSFDGSFIAIPLIYDDQNYGVLCFESLKKNNYTNADVAFLKSATKIFSFILYSYANTSVLRSLLSVDVDTKLLTYDYFCERVAGDLFKAKELDVQGAIALIQLDEFMEQDSLFEGDPFPKVLKSVAKLISDEMTPLNVLGRLNDRVFGVHFFNATAKDVFLWAEKLRIKIARKPIAVLTKQTTFTVSIGVASTHGKTDVKEVIYNAELALKKALEKGGNSVKSLN
jgi:diguanylate cyclase (GGDEF)-like protein